MRKIKIIALYYETKNQGVDELDLIPKTLLFNECLWELQKKTKGHLKGKTKIIT